MHIKEEAEKSVKAQLKSSKTMNKSSTLQSRILKEGEFLVGERIVKRSKTALLCKMNNRNKFRIWLIKLTENPWFDRFILVCIVINSICMALFDYRHDNEC
jgi:hypothetical protein